MGQFRVTPQHRLNPAALHRKWQPELLGFGQPAGATEDEIADVLLVIAPVAGLGRVVCAAADVATALGYDVAAALEEPDGC